MPSKKNKEEAPAAEETPKAEESQVAEETPAAKDKPSTKTYTVNRPLSEGGESYVKGSEIHLTAARAKSLGKLVTPA